jgi:hypothetical protein
MSDQLINNSSPYLGLIPYSEVDARFFFGRERDTRVVASNLVASALTVLYGASGVGKSSILRAGVIRRLRERQDVVVLSFAAWQLPPIPSLKVAVANALREVFAPSTWPSDNLELGDYLSACANLVNRRLLIILDQFDEYFLYHPSDDSFAIEFPRAVTHPDASANFMISLREDSLAKLDLFAHSLPSLFDNLLRIEHLDMDAARRAIVEPIDQYNRQQGDLKRPITIQKELVESVLEQIKTGEVVIGDRGRGTITTERARIETPFLQLVMTRLWTEEMTSRSHVLRLETLERLGGAANVVRTHLDAVMSTLETTEQELAAAVFKYLVTPSGTKIAHTLGDLALYSGVSESEIKRVLDKLSSGELRILRAVFHSQNQSDQPRYEIFHDVLAPAILDWRARYVNAAAAEAARAETKMIEQMRFGRRIRTLTLVSAIILLLTVMTTLLAFYLYRKARVSERAAIESRLQAEKNEESAQRQADFARKALKEAEEARRQIAAAKDEAEQRAKSSGGRRKR